jgi:hypothetical protein
MHALDPGATCRGAHVVLQLRAAALTLNRWNAFWRKISLYGVMIEADGTIVSPDPLHHLGITPSRAYIGLNWRSPEMCLGCGVRRIAFDNFPRREQPDGGDASRADDSASRPPPSGDAWINCISRRCWRAFEVVLYRHLNATPHQQG